MMKLHNIVNGQYFKEAALDFLKNGGMYTRAPKRSREYYEYWAEQERRCRDGYQVGGVWITGRHYFHLNFQPMWKVSDDVAMKAYDEAVSKKTGKISQRTAEKIFDFARMNEMQYEWWRFKHIAWEGGEFMGVKSDGGRHLACAKTRGAGFSYMEGADGVYNFTFIDGSKSYYFASLEDYLVKDGILNKVSEGLTWIDKHCHAWKQNRKVKSTMMHQKASYLDEYGVEQGTKSEIIGQTVDNPNKAHPYSQKLYTPKGYQKWEEIQKGDLVFGSDGKPTLVEDTFELGEKEIFRITFSDGRTAECTEDHLWNVSYWDNKYVNGKAVRVLVNKTLETNQLIKRVNSKSYGTNKVKVQLNGEVEYQHLEVPVDPYTLGLLLGDGSLKKSTNTLGYLTMKWEDVDCIKDSIPYKVDRLNWGGDIRNKIEIPNLRDSLKSLGLFGKVSSAKFIPDSYKYNSSKVRLSILNGLLDTDGTCSVDYGVIEYSTKSERLANDFMWVVYSLGFGGKKSYKIINGETYYRCYIYCSPEETRLFNLKRKKSRIKNKTQKTRSMFIDKYVHIEKIEYSHKELAKCIKVKAEDSLYLVGDFIVTHNTRGKRGRKATFEEAGSFKNLKQALEIAMGSMRDGDFYVGQITVFGTGGEEGPGIQGLEDIFTNPRAYDMLSFPNVYDDNWAEIGYFVPSFRANFVYTDADGNIDYEKAINADNTARELKKLDKDPKALDARKAEYPQTPSELFQRLRRNDFNVSELRKNIRKIETSSYLKMLLRNGNIVDCEDSPRGVRFEVDPDARPIDVYPHNQSDDLTGCVTIAEFPYEMEEGSVPEEMYFITFDSYYKDDAEDLTSLFDITVWKQYNKYDNSNSGLPVAWYTGRPKSLATCHEILFKLCRLYGCKAQGEISGGGQAVVDYAKARRLLHLLEFEPEMLHNKEIASNGKNRSYLMNMTTERKKLGMTYLVEWHKDMRGIAENGANITNIDRCLKIGLLREMVGGGIRNSDRMSSAIVAMFMFKEKIAIASNTVESDERESFFSRQLFSDTVTSHEYVTPIYGDDLSGEYTSY